MADNKKTTEDKKIQDVAHPGKTAPSPNSRSVIITHRPRMSDPMVAPLTSEGKDAPDSSEALPSAPLVPAKLKAPELSSPLSITVKTNKENQSPLPASNLKVNHGITLQPLAPAAATGIARSDTNKTAVATTAISTDDSTISAAAATVAPSSKTSAELTPELAAQPEIPSEQSRAESEQVAAKLASEKSLTAKPEAALESAKKVESTTSPESPATQDAPAGHQTKTNSIEPVSDERALELAAEEAAKQAAALQKLIDEKTYFLPINSVEKRRTKRTIALGVVVSVLLLLLWADIALDAGLIHLGGLKALTHFFSN